MRCDPGEARCGEPDEEDVGLGEIKVEELYHPIELLSLRIAGGFGYEGFMSFHAMVDERKRKRKGRPYRK